MGWLDKVTAASKLAAEQARNAASKGIDYVESEYSDDGRFERMKDSTALLARGSSSIANQVTGQADEKLTQLGETRAGIVVGESARSLAAFAGDLPLVSVLGDTVRSRHGVDQLAQSLADDPTDPQRALYLAEAMHKCETDMAAYTRIRSATSLTFALRRSIIASTLELGDEESDPAKVRLLKSAFNRARARLLRDPRDTDALDITARVYLLTGRPENAATMAKVCVSVDPLCGSGWVTLARAYLGLSMNGNTRRAATKAVELGAGYGYILLASAELLETDAGALQSIERYEATKARCLPSDREVYMGFSGEGSQILEDIFSRQSGKIKRLTDRRSTDV